MGEIIIAAPFRIIEGSAPFTADSLIHKIRSVFSQLPDNRKKATSNNLIYEVQDAALSAFSVFFAQSPSFLEYQTRMQKAHGKNNAQSLFGVHQIPSSNQIRNILDKVQPERVYPVLAEIGVGLYEHGYLDSYRRINNTLLLALDGTDFFSSEKITCPSCTTQTLKNGKTCYRHTAMTAVIVAPGQSQVVPLPPEFIQPQDGQHKQDCEISAAKRWLDTWSEQYAPWNVTILGDDLYCHQPFCQAAINAGFNVLLVCKPDSHAVLYEWLADFERTGQIRTLEKTRWNGKKRLTEHYRYMNQLPLRNGDDALHLNWCELLITDEASRVVYQNAWATTHTITDTNIVELVASGRARWKIENENNNVLKNQGYNFDHNFGHGKQYLANLLATLILLAYLLHTTLDWIDARYHAVRGQLSSRRMFFEHWRTLMLYLPFDSWDHLMSFMLDKLAGTKHGSG